MISFLVSTCKLSYTSISLVKLFVHTVNQAGFSGSMAGDKRLNTLTNKCFLKKPKLSSIMIQYPC